MIGTHCIWLTLWNYWEDLLCIVLHLAVLMRQEITMNCSRRFCSCCVDHFGYFQCVAVGDPSGVSAERLGKLWRISEEDAQIEHMTQLGRLSSNTTLKES